jgi:hypothetical protein
VGSTVLLTILQIAAGGSLVQIALRLGAFIYKRFSRPEQRKATVSADATSVETAAGVLTMVRGELERVLAEQASERQRWDTERLSTTAAMDNAAREMARANAELARYKSELSVARSQLAQRDSPGPGRHSTPPSAYDDWRKGT